MNQINKKYLIVMVCTLLLFTLGTKVKATNFTTAKELFLTGRKNFYASQQKLSQIISTLKKSQKQFNRLNNNYKKYYWQAQAEFVIAEIYEVQQKPRKAAQAFSSSENLIKQALQNKETSDALRVLGDNYMRQIKYKGALYKVTHGPKTLKILKKAVKLDNKNYQAYNSLGTYYIKAPKIGGGDKDKGVKMINKALESNNEFNNFISYQRLSEAYQKAYQTDKALNYINQALKIYPTSLWAKELKKEIRR